MGILDIVHSNSHAQHRRINVLQREMDAKFVKHKDQIEDLTEDRDRLRVRINRLEDDRRLALDKIREITDERRETCSEVRRMAEALDGLAATNREFRRRLQEKEKEAFNEQWDASEEMD